MSPSKVFEAKFLRIGRAIAKQCRTREVLGFPDEKKNVGDSGGHQFTKRRLPVGDVARPDRREDAQPA